MAALPHVRREITLEIVESVTHRLTDCGVLGRLDTARMGNTLIVFGVALLLTGLLWNILSKVGLPVLPGDILIRNERVTVYIPIVTSAIISIAVSVFLHLFRK